MAYLAEVRYRFASGKWPPMKLSSFSIGTLMFLVAIAAVDASLLRHIDVGQGNAEILSSAGVFVMVNILAFVLLRIVSVRGRDCAFLAGFVFAGTMAVLAYLAFFRWYPDHAVELWLKSRDPIERICKPYAPGWFMACFYQVSWDKYPFYLKYPMDCVVLPFMTLPSVLAQLLVALIGGGIGKVVSWSGKRKRDRSAIE